MQTIFAIMLESTENKYVNASSFLVNLIEFNETSCYFQALTANATIRDNIFFNGPRAGINFNDGFGGGSVITGNLLFNFVRETADHGQFNSWDRRPYKNWIGGQLSW